MTVLAEELVEDRDDEPERGQGDVRRCFGDWLLHVARNDEPYLEKHYGTIRTKGPMAEGSGTAGGFSRNGVLRALIRPPPRPSDRAGPA